MLCEKVKFELLFKIRRLVEKYNGGIGMEKRSSYGKKLWFEWQSFDLGVMQ